MKNSEIKVLIRSIPDFPKQGILFRDITPVLKNPEAFRSVISKLASHAKKQGATAIVSAESRGFILGAALAYKLKLPFMPLRKPGKLPYKTIRQDFTTEYSTDAFEIHEDALSSKDRAYIVDDVLATGGTVNAAIALCKKLGAEVSGIGFLIELKSLNGRKNLGEYAKKVKSIIKYK
ncbi:MAG: adenine phosphoribosyltransferase [Candidatus Woesearchaeota archaeon]